MRLREENETLMETLVRAKVELAETQGEPVVPASTICLPYHTATMPQSCQATDPSSLQHDPRPVLRINSTSFHACSEEACCAGAGDYLKTRRALLRSVEKQAHMADRLDSLKSAVSEGNLANATSLLLTSSPVSKDRSSGGNLESLDERDAY